MPGLILITTIVKERIASNFISKDGFGRILLAGDAAHVHSVNGGQGLNTGMADAFSVAWRLATVIKNTHLKADAASKFINSYDIERRSTAQGVIDVAAALVRDTIREAKDYVGTIQRNAGYITGTQHPRRLIILPKKRHSWLTYSSAGMGVSYRESKSPIVIESEHDFWKAGNRCPDVVLTPKGGAETRLYTETSYGKYLVLSVGKASTSEFGFEKSASRFDILPQSATVGAPSTEPNGAAEQNSTAANESGNNKSFTADWIQDDDSFVVVVRPDMYIGYVGDEEGAKKHLGDLFNA